MRAAKLLLLATIFVSGCTMAVVDAGAQDIVSICSPKIIDNRVVATAAQRKAAGEIAQPPINDLANGFAWPDTPLGVAKIGGRYVFFGSDGGLHLRQLWHGHLYGNDKYGSITRTVGTLDDPLGLAPPADVTINRNPDATINAFYRSYDYMGGGPVYKVPTDKPGHDNLLLLYHAEIPTITSFYSVLGLASSTNEGASWTDLGEIVRINQGYRTDMDGFDVGDPSLVVSPDGKYFYVYFPDWRANGTVHWGDTVTFASVARAPLDDVLQAAFGKKPHAIAFQKYYDGWRLDQGLGGYSQDLNQQTPYSGTLQVAYNDYLQRYQMIVNAGVVLYYSESKNGLTWSPLSLLFDFRSVALAPSVYVAPVGMGDDPNILGQQYYIFYTSYPSNGTGWQGATVRRFTVSCP